MATTDINQAAEKEYCHYCGANTYHPCTSRWEAGSVCCIGDYKSAWDIRPGDIVKGQEVEIPSAYTDEAYTKAVYRPHHYAKYKVEPITFIMQNELPYAVGNVIKYVMRYKDKNGLEDLKKARRYIDMIIEQEYGKDSV